MNRSYQRRRNFLVAVLAVALLQLTGCGGDDTQPEATPASLDTSAAPTNTEQAPPDTGGGGTSVNLPSAPVGGQSEQVGDDPAFQCLSVNWLAGDDAAIPDGATVALGKFSFDPAVLDVDGDGCESQGPHCEGFEFTSSELSCSLPVHWNGTPFDPEVSQASANVNAVASCSESSSECTSFLAAVVQQSPSQLSVTLPFIEETTSTEPTETSTAG